VGRIYLAMREQSGPERVERAVVALAEAQSGVIGYRQLRALDVSRPWIGRRVEMGWLIPILHGVYAVGHRPRLLRGWHNAALLAAGERSALSNRSAGAHWGMTKPPGRPHVIAPRSADGIEGIVMHRPRALADGDIVEDQGLRVASPTRTLLDLAGEGASKRALERALDQAEVHHLHLPIEPLLHRCRRRRGAPVLRAVLEWHQAGSTITESEAEEAFLAIVRAAGLPDPVPQCPVEGKRRDFVWPQARVVVEIDSRAYHDTERGFEQDRVRDNEVGLAGWLPLRFTRRRVVLRGAEVQRDLIRAFRVGSRAP
jgi:very-short-patch-repair endonuclease